MKDRHHTALTAVVLTLGFVLPFVVGWIAHRHLPEIRGTLAAFRPGRANEGKWLRFRFDMVRIGMAAADVELLLGKPGPYDWITPTHAETWWIENGGVAHKTWGPPWKVYFLTPGGDGEESQQWTADGVQAFVAYDRSRNVEQKVWFDRRVDPPHIFPPFFGAVVTATCVWLTVWTVNHRKRLTKRTRAAIAVLSSPVLYVAGFGPACYISSRIGLGNEFVSSVYQPLLALDSPRIIRRVIGRYASAFAAKDWVISGPSSRTDSNGVTTIDPRRDWRPPD